MKRLTMGIVAVGIVIGGCKKEQPPAEPAPKTVVAAAGTGSAQAAGSGSTGAAAGKAPAGCNSDFAEAVTADWTLTEKCSPYQLAAELNVSGWNLTIEPGVEIQVADNGNIAVGYGSQHGKLVAHGTAEKPIRFVAQRKEPGVWKGLFFYDAADGSVLENVVLENAGSDDRAALTSESAVTLKGVKVIGAKHKAIAITAKKACPALADLDLSAANALEDPLDVEAMQLGSLSNLKLAPKAFVGFSGNSQGDLKVPSLGVPLRLAGDWEISGLPGNKSGTVSFEPGVRVEVGENGIIWVGYHTDAPAAIKAVGTAEKPIVFTRYGDDPKHTPWRGINLGEGGRASELSYVKIEYAGLEDAHGMITFHNARSLGSITHCTFSHGRHGVFVLAAREGFTAFDENSFDDVAAGSVSLPIGAAKGFGAKNKFAADSYVSLGEEQLHEDLTLGAGVPWRKLSNLTIEGSEAGKSATLTLEAGATLALGEGAGIWVGYGNSGKLVAVGTPDKPITLKGIESPWKGIELNEKGTVQLENVVLQGIGDDDYAIRTAAGSQGSVKNVSFKGIKKGLHKCSEKLETSGNKADKGKAEIKEEC